MAITSVTFVHLSCIPFLIVGQYSPNLDQKCIRGVYEFFFGFQCGDVVGKVSFLRCGLRLDVS